jgi:HK97 family phage prohead protease
MIEMRAAALQRADAVRQRADRPSQRRDREGRQAVRAHLAGISLRAKAADGEPSMLSFTGHASVTDEPYQMYDQFGPYTELVSSGAFDETLNRSDLDVPLVLGHDQMRRVARTTTGTLRLEMDDQGLLVDADLDPTDLDVQYIAPKLRSGLIDEMSFAFRITRGIWSPDYTEYRIDQVDIHRGDVAVVGYGANPFTDSGLRAAAKPDERAQALLRLALAR